MPRRPSSSSSFSLHPYCMCEKLLHTADAIQFDRWNGSSDNNVSMHFINFFVFTMSHKQFTHIQTSPIWTRCMSTHYAGRQAHFKREKEKKNKEEKNEKPYESVFIIADKFLVTTYVVCVGLRRVCESVSINRTKTKPRD